MKIFKDVIFVAAALSVSALTLTATAVPAYANEAAVLVDAQVKQTIFDATGARVAKVFRVKNDGSVLVIYRGQVRKIDAATLSNNDGKLTTSLTRREIARLK